MPAGDVLELTASHPTEGVAFYTLDQRPGSSPRFIRGERCSQCHLLPDSGGTLGLLMMSVLPRLPGDRRPVQGWPVDLRTPVVDRWGGWYVTGKRLPPRHRGTVISAGTAAPIGTGGTPAHAELARYAAPSSDVVALLVLTHQVHVTNAIVRLGRELQASSSTKLSARARVLVTELADALLSTGAAPLTSPVEGALAFVRWFEGQGRRDDQERTLRTLDLSDRLFRYPLSYMIESTAFGNLPAAARAAVYLEVRDRLDRSARNSGLASDERARWQAALEIVRHTQPEFGK